MQRKISIIIVTYNSQEFLADCFSSIASFLDIEAKEVEVIIVDNSTGKDAAELRLLVENHSLNKILDVKYIHNTKNLGYGQGNNVGIKASSGEIVCIMNPDVRFGSSILLDVIQKFKNPNLALLSYKQLGGFDYSFYLRPEYKNIFTGIIMKMANKIDYFSSKYFYLSGAFFFIDKKKFEEAGAFDEKIFLYFEEPDIAKRITDKKYEIQYDNSKKYYHLVGDRVQYSEKSFESEMKSLKYYLQKFNFNEKKIISNYLGEYKVKMVAAKVLKDDIRLDKFKKEVALIKSIFNI